MQMNKKLSGRHLRYALALDLETIWAQRPLLLLTSITTINKIMDIFMGNFPKLNIFKFWSQK